MVLDLLKNSFSEYSNEQIIDLMEREQDAIVLKLMKEIQSLKQENKQLRLNQYNNSNNNNNNNNSPCITSTSNNTGIMSAPITPSVRRSSSLSSRSSSTSASTSSYGNNNNNSSNSNNNNNNSHSRSGSISTLMTSSPVFNYPFREQQKEALIYHNNCNNNSEVIKKKQKSELNTNGRRISLKYDEVVDENKNLKRELKKLQDELELLKNSK